MNGNIFEKKLKAKRKKKKNLSLVISLSWLISQTQHHPASDFVNQGIVLPFL